MSLFENYDASNSKLNSEIARVAKRIHNSELDARTNIEPISGDADRANAINLMLDVAIVIQFNSSTCSQIGS